MSAPHAPVRHRTRWIVLGVVGAVLVAVVLLVFEPQTLFIDTRVDDAFPGAEVGAAAGSSSATSADDPTATPRAAEPTTAGPTPATAGQGVTEAVVPSVTPSAVEGPVALASGSFLDRDHPTSGTATVFELADGARVLRLEDLVTDNGPDLKVYLSTATADAPGGEFDEDAVDLGVLAGNLGNQNYAIPEGVDVSRYASVVIWCDRFDVPFGAADLV